MIILNYFKRYIFSIIIAFSLIIALNFIFSKNQQAFACGCSDMTCTGMVNPCAVYGFDCSYLATGLCCDPQACPTPVPTVAPPVSTATPTPTYCTSDADPNTGCYPNPCSNYSDLFTTSVCTCPSAAPYACLYVTFCGDDADPNTGCYPNPCSSYVGLFSTSACTCPSAAPNACSSTGSGPTPTPPGGGCTAASCTTDLECAVNTCKTDGTCSGPVAAPAGTACKDHPGYTCNSQGNCLIDVQKSAIFKLFFSGYQISGSIFEDLNENGIKDAGELPYLLDMFIARDEGSPVNSKLANGDYGFGGLLSEDYTIAFSLPIGSDYAFTYPQTPSNTLTVSVGTPCSFAGSLDASCSFGNIINLNAGVTIRKDPWFQSIGSDIRWDNGLMNNLKLPSATTYASKPYEIGRMPGIIFSGATPFSPETQASANPFNWHVGSFSNPEFFTATHSVIPTSYGFLLETARGSRITPVSIASLADIPTDSTAHNIYQVEGNLDVDTVDYTFPTNQNFIILIHGNLNISKGIFVPVGSGSTAIFSASNNITVDKSVTQIDGLYSADKYFTVEGSICPITDDPLNVEGTVVANAGRYGGSFINDRTLCAGNSTTPSVVFKERPDFMLNYPSMVQQTTRSWQEIAP